MAKKVVKLIQDKAPEPIIREVTREELYLLIKSFDGVKAPFSPHSRKLFSIYRLNRDAFEEIDKFKKEYDLKIEEYNKQVFEIAQKYADKDEEGELKSVVNNHSGQVSWNFTSEQGAIGLKKLKELKKEFKPWLDYMQPDNEFQKFLSEKVEFKYTRIIKSELTKLNAQNLVDLVLILPTEITENDLPSDITFEQMRVISQNVEII